MTSDKALDWAIHQMNLPGPPSTAEVRAKLMTTWDLTERQADETIKRALVRQGRSDRVAGFGGVVVGAIVAVVGFGLSAGLSDFSDGANLGSSGLGGDFLSVSSSAFVIGGLGALFCARSLWLLFGPNRKAPIAKKIE